NDARILKDRLDVLHQLLALAGVGDGEGGIELLVEVRIRIGRLVPRLAGAVGECNDLHAERAHVPIGTGPGIFRPVVPEAGARDYRTLDLEARLPALRGNHGAGGL